jgi:hypothetical protein
MLINEVLTSSKTRSPQLYTKIFFGDTLHLDLWNVPADPALHAAKHMEFLNFLRFPGHGALFVQSALAARFIHIVLKNAENFVAHGLPDSAARNLDRIEVA